MSLIILLFALPALFLVGVVSEVLSDRAFAASCRKTNKVALSEMSLQWDETLQRWN